MQNGRYNHKQGLGDPLGVKQHTRPARSLKKWVEEYAQTQKMKMMQKTIDNCDEDLITFGYQMKPCGKPMRMQRVKIQPKAKTYPLPNTRKTFIFLREQARHHTSSANYFEKSE
jgi:hypothetical protein